jgi:polar amino acid transport system permease protein
MSFFAQTISGLLDGLRMTVILIAASVPLGLVLSIPIAIARMYGRFPVRNLAAFYQSVFRGTPLVVQLFILYFGLPRIGIILSPLSSAVLGFGLCSAAYHSEYVRSAFLSIPTGQMEAARALGLNRFQAITWIVLPQAARRAIPGCTNEIVYLVKYSSLAYMVTLVELTGAGRLIAYRTFRFFEVFLIVGFVYVGLVGLVTIVLRWIEDRWSIPRAGKD